MMLIAHFVKRDFVKIYFLATVILKLIKIKERTVFSILTKAIVMLMANIFTI